MVSEAAYGGAASEAAETRDRLLYDAVIEFQAGRLEDAEAKSQRLLAASPRFFPALLLLGMIAGKTGRAIEGIELLRQAVGLERRSADARNELATLLRTEGRTDEAIIEANHAVRLEPDDPGSHNNLALCHLAAGRLPRAITHFKRAIGLKPDAAMFHHNLGLALQQQLRDAEATAAFRRAIELDPANAEALAHLGQLLFAHGNATEAAACYDRAAAAQSDATLGALHRAEVLMQQGDAVEAEACLRDAIASDPDSDLAHQVLGVLLQRCGRFDEANSCFERAIELQPKRVSAYLNLAMGKKIESAADNLVRSMLALVNDPSLAPFDRSRLHYALGKAYDDLGEYEAAVRNFDRAHEIDAELMRRAGRSFDRKGFKARIDRTIARFTAASFARAAPTRSDSELPILIVGMPRSGTTLVEQILSSHLDIGAAGELSFWTDRGAVIDRAPLAGPSEIELRRMADDYCGQLRAIAPAARRVTDKMPANFLELGLINRALPGARIIHCRRKPVDTCLSIYVTPFGNALDFAHDRSDIVFFYQQYARIMAHWRAVLPADRFLEIDYEMLVAEPEQLIRRMIGFCRLEWDDVCLRHERNKNIIMTPSLWQARQPVYHHAVERWRHYENWLGSFRDLIDPAL